LSKRTDEIDEDTIKTEMTYFMISKCPCQAAQQKAVVPSTVFALMSTLQS